MITSGPSVMLLLSYPCKYHQFHWHNHISNHQTSLSLWTISIVVMGMNSYLAHIQFKKKQFSFAKFQPEFIVGLYFKACWWTQCYFWKCWDLRMWRRMKGAKDFRIVMMNKNIKFSFSIQYFFFLMYDKKNQLFL